MFKRLSIIAAICVTAASEAPQALVWEEFYFVPPELGTCTPDQALLLEHVEQCLRLTGFAEIYGMSSTADGYIGVENAILQFASAQASDAGTVAGVVVLQAATQFPNMANNWTLQPNRLLLKEAYLAVGDQTVVMVGRKRSVARLDGDEARDMLGPFGADRSRLGQLTRQLDGPYIPDEGLKLPTDLALLGIGTSVQVRGDVSPGWTSYVALEEVDRLDGGALVAGAAYDGEQLRGHLTLVSDGALDGIIDNWGTHSVVSADFDLIAATFAAVMTSSGYWHGMASAEARLDRLRLAGSVEQLSTGQWGWAASGRVDLGIIDLEAGMREHRTPIADARQVAGILTIAPLESMTASIEVGSYVTSGRDYSFGADYLAARVRWEPGGGVRAEVRHERYSNGAARTAIGVSKVIQ